MPRSVTQEKHRVSLKAEGEGETVGKSLHHRFLAATSIPQFGGGIEDNKLYSCVGSCARRIIETLF